MTNMFADYTSNSIILSYLNEIGRKGIFVIRDFEDSYCYKPYTPIFDDREITEILYDMWDEHEIRHGDIFAYWNNWSLMKYGKFEYNEEDGSFYIQNIESFEIEPKPIQLWMW